MGVGLPGGFEETTLKLLDRNGYIVLEALAHDDRRSPHTHAKPHTFICIDAKTYWVKGTAQQGLVAELIAGRLAAKIGAGPPARIIRVAEGALPAQEGEVREEAKGLLGVVVGMEDQHGTVNARELQPLVDTGTFQPGVIDPRSRALVIAFQSWLGVDDAQVLVRLTDGTVLSIDHGASFNATGNQGLPGIVITDIPGITADVGKEMRYVEPALRKIEGISDGELLESVSRVPLGEPWRSPVERRIEIAHWLARRRDALRGVMITWTKR